MIKGRWNKKRKLIYTGTFLVLAATVGGTFLFKQKSRATTKNETTVSSATASTGNISTSITGTGTLASGETTDILIPTGVVIDKILVEVGDEVKKGDKLATVKEASVASVILEMQEKLDDVEDSIDDLSDDADTEGSTEYYQLKVYEAQKEDLKEVLSDLKKMMKSKAITATSDATISSISISAGTAAGSSGSTTVTSSNSSTSASSKTATKTAAVIKTTATATKTAAVAQNAKIVRLSTSDTSSDDTDSNEKSNVTQETTTQAATTEAVTTEAATTETVKTETTQETSQTTEAENSQEENKNNQTEENNNTSDNSGETTKNRTIESCNISIAAPQTGETAQTSLSGTDAYSASISWSPAVTTFAADTEYAATIVLSAKGGYAFSSQIKPAVSGAKKISWKINGNTLTIQASFEKTGSQNNREQADNQNKNDANAAGNMAPGNQGGGMSTAGASGGSGGFGAGASGSAQAATTTSTVSYNSYESVAFSVADSNEVVVSIDVDELDIQSVSAGQSAKVTLDALEGQELEGKITGISSTANQGSSSVKYPVEISIEKTDGMILGMSASATIYIEESENALLIPVSALQEKGNKTFVYTSQEKDGTLSGETEVETGLSNGMQVEITSGLSEGDTVYYTKSESTENDFNSNGMFPGGGGDRPEGPGGEMPSGMQPPTGAPTGAPGGNSN